MKKKLFAILLLIGSAIFICWGVLCLPVEIESPVLWAGVINVTSLIVAVLSLWLINKSLNWITLVTLAFSSFIPVWNMIIYRTGVSGDAIFFVEIPLAVIINYYVAKNLKSFLVFHLYTLSAVCIALKYSMILYYNNVSHDLETPAVGHFEIIFFSIIMLLLGVLITLVIKDKPARQ